MKAEEAATKQYRGGNSLLAAGMARDTETAHKAVADHRAVPDERVLDTARTEAGEAAEPGPGNRPHTDSGDSQVANTPEGEAAAEAHWGERAAEAAVRSVGEEEAEQVEERTG